MLGAQPAGLRLSAACLNKFAVCYGRGFFVVVGSGRFEVGIVWKCDLLFPFLASAAEQTVGFSIQEERTARIGGKNTC